MKTRVNKINNDWVDVKNKCRTTINKDYSDKQPTSDWKRKLLISEHSPIRLLNINWTWENIPSWVATHWSRHKWECFISSKRSDLIGADRGKLLQEEPVNLDGEANAQHTIDTWRKRLCFHASPETREYAEDMKRALYNTEPEWSDTLVPNCVYRCGCPEHKQCGFWENFKSKLEPEQLTEIQSRYDMYNYLFWRRSNDDGMEN